MTVEGIWDLTLCVKPWKLKVNDSKRGLVSDDSEKGTIDFHPNYNCLIWHSLLSN